MNKNKLYTKRALLLFALTVFFGTFAIPVASAQEAKSELPKEKQTTLGLYVTSAEAYDMWKADPEKVKILDVRTPEEYMFIGHAAMAWNIPAFLQTYNWDADRGHFSMKPNPDFMEQIKATFQPDDVILVTCRSGGRSAMAANQMAATGFAKVYNITDGFEGDKVTDSESADFEKRMVNGWKNSGAPWTYKLDPKLMLLPESK
jgi:rhodanese-related sulfurtransferase